MKNHSTNNAVTLDEFINRLEYIREQVGGDAALPEVTDVRYLGADGRRRPVVLLTRPPPPPPPPNTNPSIGGWEYPSLLTSPEKVV